MSHALDSYTTDPGPASFNSLEPCTATSRNIMKMEHNIVVYLVHEVFLRLVEVTHTYDLWVMLLYPVVAL